MLGVTLRRGGGGTGSYYRANLVFWVYFASQEEHSWGSSVPTPVNPLGPPVQCHSLRRSSPPPNPPPDVQPFALWIALPVLPGRLTPPFPYLLGNPASLSLVLSPSFHCAGYFWEPSQSPEDTGGDVLGAEPKGAWELKTLSAQAHRQADSQWDSRISIGDWSWAGDIGNIKWSCSRSV